MNDLNTYKAIIDKYEPALNNLMCELAEKTSTPIEIKKEFVIGSLIIKMKGL